MRDLVIVGCAYPEVVKLVDAINRHAPAWNLVGFVDDRPEQAGANVLGYPVLGTRDILGGLDPESTSAFSNVSGKVANAWLIADLLDQAHLPIANLVHPAVDLAHVRLGRGCILPEGCVVGSRTVIGDFVAARLHVVISHDVVVEDFVFIGPGAVLGGEVHVESGAFIGAGATVVTGCRIGAHSVIGAGALVAEDVPAHCTVAGVRGRVVKQGGRQ